MKQPSRIAVAAVALLSLAMSLSVHARSLLYYYDFDTVDESGNLVVTGVNKGTGTQEPAVVDKDGNAGGSCNVGKQEGGAFGDSSYAIYTGSDYSLWLPAPAADLGCGTTKGFTISFWVKPPSDTASARTWRDFFGFLIGDNRYRLEYSDVANEFRMYGAVSATAATSSRLAMVKFTPNEWSHVAIVATPNATNDNGTLTFYFNGNVMSNTVALGKGALGQIHIGKTVLGDATKPIRSTGDSSTAIDEFALFDYPATAEQVKWLTKHKPNQPDGGPGREMPIAWRFDYLERIEYVASNVVRTSNSGTEAETPRVRYYGDAAKPTDVWGGAFGSQYGYKMTSNVKTTFCSTNLTASVGLGATAGSGFAFSFWLKAPMTVNAAWAELFSFSMGDRLFKFEWTDKTWTPPGGGTAQTYFSVFSAKPGTSDNLGWTGVAVTNDSNALARSGGEWQHVAVSYDIAARTAEIYVGGSLIARSPVREDVYAFSPSECVKSVTLGPSVFYPDNEWQENGGYTSDVSVDELAFFNYSISPEEIAWLGSNIPKLPPLSATNLARTVSADCSWAGGLASWNVLDGTGADTGRLSIYPSCEDTEVEVAVSIAATATITNDTFVTPAKLKFTNGTGGASAAATISAAANSMFAPENLEVGDGVSLTVKPGDVAVADTLTFGDGAKIVFDMSNAEGAKIVTGLTVGSISLPEGESDVLSHFGARGGYTVSLSEDGKTVNLNQTNGLIILFR